MIQSMIFMSVALSFWLTELFFIITARIYQVRAELITWLGLSQHRRQVLCLVIGLWFLMGFTTFLFTYTWIKEQWTLSLNDVVVAHLLPLGIIGVLFMLWWVFGTVFERHGGKIWLGSVFLGGLLGGAVVY